MSKKYHFRSIVLLVETIQFKQFRCIYLKNENFWLNFFLQFSNLHHILNTFKKNMTLIAYLFPKLQTLKEVLK